MPWSQPKEFKDDDSHQPKGRRSVLRQEHLAADQALEWVPKEAEALRRRGQNADSEPRSHARSNIYAREVASASQALEMAPMVQVGGFDTAAAAVGEKFHGRRNVMTRETAEQSSDAPRASGVGADGVPMYNRKQMLPPCAPRATAH
jgi:hypothetical protein